MKWLICSMLILLAVVNAEAEGDHSTESRQSPVGVWRLEAEPNEVPSFLMRVGLRDTRWHALIGEAPETFAEAWAACLAWGMTLPTSRQLAVLKPHLSTLLNGKSEKEDGFIWTLDEYKNKKYPYGGYSLKIHKPIQAKKSAKGIGLCVEYIEGNEPRESRLARMMASEMESYYQTATITDKKGNPVSLYQRAESARHKFRRSFPNLSGRARAAARKSFELRRAGDHKYLASKNSHRSSDDDSGIGMTYDGKLGVDLGGGIILPFEGGGVEFGFSF